MIKYCRVTSLPTWDGWADSKCWHWICDVDMSASWCFAAQPSGVVCYDISQFSRYFTVFWKQSESAVHLVLSSVLLHSSYPLWWLSTACMVHLRDLFSALSYPLYWACMLSITQGNLSHNVVLRLQLTKVLWHMSVTQIWTFPGLRQAQISASLCV